MRKYHLFIIVVVLEVATVLAILGWSRAASIRWAAVRRPALEQLVRELELTDLALWTEARYTRHPSQADRFAAFQDFPGSLEHFPAGSVVAPPSGSGPETERGGR